MILEVKIPNLAESISEVTLGKWLVKEGSYIILDQAICEIETDKASQEIYAEQAGTIHLIVAAGDDLKIGALIAKIDTDGVNTNTTNESKEPEKTALVVKKEEKKIEIINGNSNGNIIPPIKNYPSVSAQKLITENNIHLPQLLGTGKDGRITKADVLQAIASGNTSLQQEYKELIHAPNFKSREVTIKKMARIRKTISDRLVYAKNSTAMLTTFNEVNMQPIMNIRNKYKEKFKEKHGIGLGFMSFFSKAASLSLMKFPEVNAYIDAEKGEFIYHEYVDISIAVSTPKGLVVPVIRNAESLSMADIERTVASLAEKGRKGNLSMEEMEGGTFTITNGGVFGSLMSTPILNPPQSAILGMHKIQDRAMVENGQMIILPMMYVALSYDHRIIDGKESVGFLVMIKDLLENPHKLLLGEDPIESLLQMN